MKTRKIMFFTAMTAVALTAALLVTNCLEPLTMTMAEAPGRTTSIRLVFGGDERTVMPVAPIQSEIEGFTYGLTIECTGTETGDDEMDVALPNINYAALTGSRELLTGKFYDISIIAYSTYIGLGDPGNTIIGTYTSASPIEITGIITSIPVVLQPNKTSGNGTLAWDITYNGNAGNLAGLGTTTLGIYQLTDLAFATPVGALTDLKATASGTIQVPAGQYRMRITLSLAGHRSVIVTEALHIYANMTSTYPARDFSTLTATTFTITFNYNTTPPITSEVSTEDWDSLIAYTPPTGHISKTGSVITEWYRVASPVVNTPPQAGDDEPWDFDVDKVYSARTLYAQWAETSKDVPISISFGAITDSASSLTLASSLTMSIAEVKAGTYTFSFAAGALDGVTTVTWFIGARPGTTGNSLNITAADLQYLVTGTNIVNIDFLIGGNTYSKEFTFNLTNSAGL